MSRFAKSKLVKKRFYKNRLVRSRSDERRKNRPSESGSKLWKRRSGNDFKNKPGANSKPDANRKHDVNNRLGSRRNVKRRRPSLDVSRSFGKRLRSRRGAHRRMPGGNRLKSNLHAPELWSSNDGLAKCNERRSHPLPSLVDQ